MTTVSNISARTFTIDKAHSEAVFQVRYLVTKVRGRFSDFEGMILYHEAIPELSSVQFTVQAASIDTNEKDRDGHLRSADFFDVEKHPTLTFRSTRILKRSEASFDVGGDLTIHGVTKLITLPVTYLGKAKDPWGNERIGFEADTTLNRKDFGLTWNAALETGGFLVGDDVNVALSIQAIAQ